MMFSMGDAQKHSSSSTPPRRTTGRTIRVPRNRPGRHNGIPIHSCAIPTYLAAAPIDEGAIDQFTLLCRPPDRLADLGIADFSKANPSCFLVERRDREH